MVSGEDIYNLALGTKTRRYTWDRLGEWCVRTHVEDREIRVYRTMNHHEFLVFNTRESFRCCTCGMPEILSDLIEGIFDDASADRVYIGRVIEKWREDFHTQTAVAWSEMAGQAAEAH